MVILHFTFKTFITWSIVQYLHFLLITATCKLLFNFIFKVFHIILDVFLSIVLIEQGFQDMFDLSEAILSGSNEQILLSP